MISPLEVTYIFDFLKKLLIQINYLKITCFKITKKERREMYFVLFYI